MTLPTLFLFGTPEPFCTPAALSSRIAAGGVLVMKVKRAVGEDRDHHRDDQALLRLRAGVEGLAELHDVHAVLAEGRADRRSRSGLRRRGSGA